MNSVPKTRWLLVSVVLLSVVTLTGFGCRRSGVLPDSTNQTLVMWGLWQESSDMEALLSDFKTQTGIQVEYKKMASVASYEKDLLEALAQGRGPDVFAIHHTWVEGKRGIMNPAPPEIVNVRNVQEEFVSVVSADLVRDGFVYALPHSVDTMALYYNKDILAAAGVARPPATWQEFQRAVERITRISRIGALEQSAAALGSAANVNRAGDIVQLLMMQSGLSIINPQDGTVDFLNETGERALTFYTDFTNKSKKVYTWNLQQDYSLDAFSEGEAAMMINYSYHLPTIKAKNPRLNFGIAPLPQVGDSGTKRTFASYWPFAVANTSKSPSAAWQLIRYLTSTVPAATINQNQHVPPARTDNIAEATGDPELGVFADQSLTAVSWPRRDIVTTDAIFNRMVDDVVTGALSLQDSLSRAREQLEQVNRPNETPTT